MEHTARRLLLPVLPLAILSLNLLAPCPASANGYDYIAKKISLASKRLKRCRIAVLQFPTIDGHPCDGPRAVQERLTTQLAAKRNLQVVERASIGAVVDELALGQKGLLDPRASYQVGQILDVDAVLTGTLIELPNRKIQINARLIRIPDGLILAAAEALVKRTWNDPHAEPEPTSDSTWLERLLNPSAGAFHADAANFNPASDASPPPSSPRPAERETDSATFARGRWLYERDCTYCHGPEGRGISVMAQIFKLSRKDLDLSRKSMGRYSPQNLLSTLKTGKGKMPETQRPMDEEDAAALLQYLDFIVNKHGN